MQRLFAIAGLTWKAAFRFRLFIIIAVLLLASVIGLPLIIKDDGTARGFTQIMLTYTLSVITTLLGLSTLWLACGTLARDIEECQMQMVATKPVARWQIWLGKWLGIVSLNAVLLLIAGVSVYALLQYRATKLPPNQQRILHNEIFVARGVARESSLDAKIEQDTEAVLRERMEQNPALTNANLAVVRQQIQEQVKAEYQTVPPGYERRWKIDLGLAKNILHDQPLFLRVKFNAAQGSPSGTFYGVWDVGNFEGTNFWESEVMSLAPDTFHEIEIPANLFDQNGVLNIAFRNMNGTTLLFPLTDGMEVLYREGGFAMNLARGLGIILCWMALLAALGLAAASFLSFPVAAFFSLGLLALVWFNGSISMVVSEGRYFSYNAEKGSAGPPGILDQSIVQTFRGILVLIDMVKDFSPVNSLSAGRSISWEELGRAFGQIVLVIGGIVSGIGILIFSRRELATAQGTQ